jgi:hypothetical protein
MEAIDCSSTLTPATAAALKSSDIVAVGRYLGYKAHGWDKSMSPAELAIIQAAGLSAVLIWESDPTSAAYFGYGQGLLDAQSAIVEANYLGAPKGTAIYFVVDFDAQPADMAAIIAYFNGVRAGLAGQYLVGAYSSYAVLQALQTSAYAPDKYWQTYAWSGGQVFEGNSIYQYQNNVFFEGVNVDRNTIENNSGCWPEIGGNSMFANLVIYSEGADARAAQYLADYLKAPIVELNNVTPELLACATTKYKVGGPSYAGATMVMGGDRFSTMEAVLKLVGEI